MNTMILLQINDETLDSVLGKTVSITTEGGFTLNGTLTLNDKFIYDDRYKIIDIEDPGKAYYVNSDVVQAVAIFDMDK